MKIYVFTSRFSQEVDETLSRICKEIRELGGGRLLLVEQGKGIAAGDGPKFDTFRLMYESGVSADYLFLHMPFGVADESAGFALARDYLRKDGELSDGAVVLLWKGALGCWEEEGVPCR